MGQGEQLQPKVSARERLLTEGDLPALQAAVQDSIRKKELSDAKRWLAAQARSDAAKQREAGTADLLARINERLDDKK